VNSDAFFVQFDECEGEDLVFCDSLKPLESAALGSQERITKSLSHGVILGFGKDDIDSSDPGAVPKHQSMRWSDNLSRDDESCCCEGEGNDIIRQPVSENAFFYKSAASTTWASVSVSTSARASTRASFLCSTSRPSVDMTSSPLHFGLPGADQSSPLATQLTTPCEGPDTARPSLEDGSAVVMRPAVRHGILDGKPPSFEHKTAQSNAVQASNASGHGVPSNAPTSANLKPTAAPATAQAERKASNLSTQSRSSKACVLL